jgi:hypothetical protein
MLKIKEVKPLFTKVITTASVFEEDDVRNGVILNPKGAVKPYQKVVKVGSMVRDVKVGELVMINPAAYIKKKYSDNSLREDIVDNPTIKVDIPTIEMNGENYFMIEERDIEFVITDYEEKEEKFTIIEPVDGLLLS